MSATDLSTLNSEYSGMANWQAGTCQSFGYNTAFGSGGSSSTVALANATGNNTVYANDGNSWQK